MINQQWPLIILLSFISCQSIPKEKKWQLIKSMPNYREKRIPVTSVSEAEKVIENHTNFLKMIFEQSIDPYFGTPKWSESCLGENIIGNIYKTTRFLYSESSLFLDREGGAGHCKETSFSKKSRLVYLYCEGSKEVIEFKYALSSGENFTGKELCL